MCGGLDGVDDDAGALGELLPPSPLVGGADVVDVGDAVEESVCVFTPVPDVQPASRATTVEEATSVAAVSDFRTFDTVVPPERPRYRS